MVLFANFCLLQAKKLKLRHKTNNLLPRATRNDQDELMFDIIGALDRDCMERNVKPIHCRAMKDADVATVKHFCYKTQSYSFMLLMN